MKYIYMKPGNIKYVINVNKPCENVLLGLLDSWRWDRQAVPKRRQLPTSEHCVTYRKNENLNKT